MQVSPCPLMSKRLLGRCFTGSLRPVHSAPERICPPDACPPVSQRIWFPSSISIFSSIFVFISFSLPPPPSHFLLLLLLCPFLLSSLEVGNVLSLIQGLVSSNHISPQNFDLQPQLLMCTWWALSLACFLSELHNSSTNIATILQDICNDA